MAAHIDGRHGIDDNNQSQKNNEDHKIIGQRWADAIGYTGYYKATDIYSPKI